MATETDLLAFGKNSRGELDPSCAATFGTIMETLGKNSQTLMVQSHNTLIQDFLNLFIEYHDSQNKKDLAGLLQRQNLEQLVQRAETAGEDIAN